MKRIFVFFILTMTLMAGLSCKSKTTNLPHRPMEPWAFRSVLDQRPRMLTLALHEDFFLAYDLEKCTIYKAWKGGVTLEGAAYTDKKNVQPNSWGQPYYCDSLHQDGWSVSMNNMPLQAEISCKGYSFEGNQISFKYRFCLGSGDTFYITERPEVVFDAKGQIGLSRSFAISGAPGGIIVTSQGLQGSVAIKSSTSTTYYFEVLPEQLRPDLQAEYDHRGKYWLDKSDCMTCHEYDQSTVGPSWLRVAERYSNDKSKIGYLVKKVMEGGSGAWGNNVMNPHPDLAEKEVKQMIDYILALRPKENLAEPEKSAPQKLLVDESSKPGFGAPLEGLHPGYSVTTIHPSDFKPRVGGLAFKPDGRLLVTTWDAMGAVYMISGAESGDTNKITVKRIASGLAEPLGIQVVDGDIYVLQKQELTKLIDLDGDDIADVYETVCNGWGVTADFHEFAFGLVYKDGFFYATLSMAMRLMSHEKQKADRGRTIKIAKDGSYQWVNFGLRTPNGIGLGVDNQIFVTDNQGEWQPGNKLIHVKNGEYHGMRWGLPDSLPVTTPVAKPAIWLPENEIANSPSEPIMIPDGPYKGQMLHGDVTHGGIKRDFLELVKGEYQGAVFRFSQGLEAGVNRLRWGPDGALYIGGVGMVGGWSWKEKQYGLQRMVSNGVPTFEMLAVRIKSDGFEIEFTEPIKAGQNPSIGDFKIQQWWYQPTANYGGPKMDLENLRINKLTLAPDRKKIFLKLDRLKAGRVVYIRLPDDLPSESGRALWASETWYTLNNFPD